MDELEGDGNLLKRIPEEQYPLFADAKFIEVMPQPRSNLDRYLALTTAALSVVYFLSPGQHPAPNPSANKPTKIKSQPILSRPPKDSVQVAILDADSPPDFAEEESEIYFSDGNRLITKVGSAEYEVDRIQPVYNQSAISILHSHHLIPLESNERQPVVESVRTLNEIVSGIRDPKVLQYWLTFSKEVPQGTTTDLPPVDVASLPLLVDRLYSPN